MVIDGSALVAVLLGEPDAERFDDAIDGDPTRLISVAKVSGEPLLFKGADFSQTDLTSALA